MVDLQTCRKSVVWIYIQLTASSVVAGNWMYLGVASLTGGLDLNSQSADEQRSSLLLDCGHPPEGGGGGIGGGGGFDGGRQLKVCEQDSSTLELLRLGAKLGIVECQFQFQNDRWNCSTAYANRTVFEQVVRHGTKETAFLHAVTTAGVVHAVTTACSAGGLTDCSCDPSADGQAPSGDASWQWGGCSDNVRFGIAFAETVVDAADRTRHRAAHSAAAANDGREGVRLLANLHNNEVGRKLMTALMNTRCRCHGISGSCAVRTCWKSLPEFRQVGDGLRQKYEHSVSISPTARPAALRRREKRMRREPITELELVYVERSPNYCRQNPGRGILGTRERECTADSDEPNSCHSLCCGRGFATEELRYVEHCHCKFVWCCEVKCKTCERVANRHRCK